MVVRSQYWQWGYKTNTMIQIYSSWMPLCVGCCSVFSFAAACLCSFGSKQFYKFYGERLRSIRSEVLASGHKQASFYCTRDQLKQFSRHDVKCSVETRAWSVLLSTAARSFRASSGPLGHGIVWPLCVLKFFEPLHRKWFITGLQHRTQCACPITTSHLHHWPAWRPVWFGRWSFLADLINSTL